MQIMIFFLTLLGLRWDFIKSFCTMEYIEGSGIFEEIRESLASFCNTSIYYIY